MAAQVALKRQQAAEDRIALHLAAAAGALQQQSALPPGRIYGMTVTPPTQHNKNNVRKCVHILSPIQFQRVRM